MGLYEKTLTSLFAALLTPGLGTREGPLSIGTREGCHYYCLMIRSKKIC